MIFSCRRGFYRLLLYKLYGMTDRTGRRQGEGHVWAGSSGGRTPAGRRLAVLRLLQEAPGALTIVEIADRLGVHANTVRFHLDTLLESGQVERVETDRRAPGRPPLSFRAAHRMDPAGPRQYGLLAELLVESLADDPQRTSRALEAGRAWGRRQVSRDASEAVGADARAVSRLLGLLDEIGFAPERQRGEDQAYIGLRHCPFLELAHTRPEIVCSIHLGLMQGATEGSGSPVTVDRLEPFAEPDLCVAHLATPSSS